VSFAGLAASVDDTGVHVLGVQQSLPDRSFADNGVAVRALGTTRADAHGAARSTAGGLQVTFSVPVQGVPPVVPGLPSANRAYLGTVTIGGVGAAVGVGAPGELLLDALPAAPPSSLAARLLPPATLGTSPGTTAHVPKQGTAPPPLGSPAAAPGRRPFPQADLRWLALVLAVVPTSLLVGWRLTVRGRLR
jgi:hypothetical protein